tara:strand:+ start:206 stop:1168 length:963 start_codon:yes stop_codon:yes gene_type:complete
VKNKKYIIIIYMTNTQGSNLICIRSRDLDNTNTLGNSGRLVLQQVIQANPNEKLYVCVLSATFPNSWYNLSSHLSNNTISFKETGDSSYKLITIEDGTYNIDELMSKIKTLLDANSTNTCTYTLTYDEIKNQVNITHDKTATKTTLIDFTTSTTCRRMLGFTSSIQTIDASEGIFSDRAVDITDTFNSLYIRLPNLSNQKVVESSTGRYSNIVAHIPVPLSRNTIFTYTPPKPFCMELNQTSISAIDIEITFQNEDQRVHFGRGDWEVNLLIEYRLNMIKTAPPHTIHKGILRQMKKYEKQQIEDKKHIDEIKQLIKNKK